MFHRYVKLPESGIVFLKPQIKLPHHIPIYWEKNEKQNFIGQPSSWEKIWNRDCHSNGLSSYEVQLSDLVYELKITIDIHMCIYICVYTI